MNIKIYRGKSVTNSENFPCPVFTINRPVGLTETSILLVDFLTLKVTVDRNALSADSPARRKKDKATRKNGFVSDCGVFMDQNF